MERRSRLPPRSRPRLRRPLLRRPGRQARRRPRRRGRPRPPGARPPGKRSRRQGRPGRTPSLRPRRRRRPAAYGPLARRSRPRRPRPRRHEPARSPGRALSAEGVGIGALRPSPAPTGGELFILLPRKRSAAGEGDRPALSCRVVEGAQSHANERWFRKRFSQAPLSPSSGLPALRLPSVNPRFPRRSGPPPP